MSLSVKQLSPIGVEIVGTSVDELLQDPHVPEEVLGLLEANGVVLFRELGPNDEELLAFSRRLGEPVVRESAGWSRERPGLYTIALDPTANADAYVKGTFFWHIDGTTLDIPHKASLLAGLVLSGQGGDTQFASTYTAYNRLSDEDKERLQNLKVWHSVVAGFRRVDANYTPEVLERVHNEPTPLHPLVWTHRNGHKSLVLGETADYIDGMPEEEGRALLRELEDRATEAQYVYSHHWHVGDLVIWDNRGVLHRVEPYSESSGRVMHRVTLKGDEPIQ